MNQSIPEIGTYLIDFLKKEALHNHSIKKRKESTIVIQDFEINSKVLVSDNDLYYGGLFGFPEDSLFLSQILLDKSKIDDIFSDKVNSIKFLNSNIGKKIQRARFRDDFVKPVKKWIKNRKIVNKQFGISLMKNKMLGNFDELSSYLDKVNSYTLVDIAKWELLKNLK